MNIILLSGGSGKRLWPLSNDIRSKQFIKLFKDCLLYTSDAADDLLCVDLGGRPIIKKKKRNFLFFPHNL